MTTSSDRLILLVNDDGIHSPGLHALRDALATLGEVRVVAPAAEQSGVGLAITYLHPIMVDEEYVDGEFYGWAVHGSPADCVKLGMLQFCERKPDLVVSGINTGANIGINVLYSGTVAGAIEGAFFGVTSIAVSQAMDTAPEWPRTANAAVQVIRQILDQNGEPGALWNLNFPQHTPEGPKGVRLCSLGVRRYVDVMERRLDPRGKPYYWSGIDPVEHHARDAGTDVHELGEGYATLTPLHFDITHRPGLEKHADVNWKLDPKR